MNTTIEKNKKINKLHTAYISNGIIQVKINRILEKLVSFILKFRRIKIDNESVSTLNEYRDKGKVVYVSCQDSNTSLAITLSLLKKYNFVRPFLALGFTPYPLQMFSIGLSRFFAAIGRFFLRIKPEKISDKEYIHDIINSDKTYVFSLLSKRTFLRKFIERKSDSIQYLIDIQKESDEIIYLFPQITFWNRNPERTKTMVTSKATGGRNLFSALYTIIKSATIPFVRIAEPINIKEEIEISETDNTLLIAEHIRNKILEQYNHEKRSILGPIIKIQQEMMESVLYSDNVMKAIEDEIDNNNISEKKARKKAYKYFKEMAADFSIIYIRFFERTLNFLYHKIFDGIHYDTEDFKMIREASKKGPLIIMPSHKSHMDYLIISSIFYLNKLIPPHIWSGTNLLFFPMGKIFRRSGAFFVRRSFRGLNLYAVMLKQYIKSLIAEKYSIEFFIEGGRSRSGKLGFPQMGTLKYMVDAVDEGYNDDLVFLPVAINYDRILEESSYHKELKGKQKEKESTSGFLQSRKLLKRKYGKVYLSFDKPVTLSELRKDVKENESVVSHVGNHIIRKISNIIMITPFSLITTSILLSSSRAFSKENIKKTSLFLYEYLKTTGAKMSDDISTALSIDASIDYVLKAYENDQIIRKLDVENEQKDDENIEEVYTLAEDERLRIDFYKNSIIHFFLPIGFVAIALIRFVDEKTMKKNKIKDIYLFLKDLFSKEFLYPESMDDTDKIFDEVLIYLEKRSLIEIENDNIIFAEKGNSELGSYGALLQNFLESYYIMLTVVLATEHDKLKKKELLKETKKVGIKMYHQKEVNLTESLSSMTYGNVLKKLEEVQIVEIRQLAKKSFEVEIIDRKKAEVLKETISGYIDEIRKNMSLNSLIDLKSIDIVEADEDNSVEKFK